MQRLKARETEDIPLVKLTPMVLEMGHRDFTNRVSRDTICPYYSQNLRYSSVLLLPSVPIDDALASYLLAALRFLVRTIPKKSAIISQSVLKDERRDSSLRLSPDFPCLDCSRMVHARRVPYEVAIQAMQGQSRPHFYHGSKQSKP
jgi:hypothetical protein